MNRLGFVRTERAKAWAEASHDYARARGEDRLEKHYARSQRHTAYQEHVSYQAGLAAGRAANVRDQVMKIAGEACAERDGYKAQLSLAERKLKAANRRLESAGAMPVTSFFC